MLFFFDFFFFPHLVMSTPRDWPQVHHQEIDGLSPFEVVCGLVQCLSATSW